MSTPDLATSDLHPYLPSSSKPRSLSASRVGLRAASVDSFSPATLPNPLPRYRLHASSKSSTRYPLRFPPSAHLICLGLISYCLSIDASAWVVILLPFDHSAHGDSSTWQSLSQRSCD